MVGLVPTKSQAATFEQDVLDWESLFTQDLEAVYTLSRSIGNKGFGSGACFALLTAYQEIDT
jgi:hypothetical protein